MCKMYGKEFDDEWFENIEPLKWNLMFQNWLVDQEEKMEFARAYSILIGSFANPEMARKMSEAKIISSSDEDFDKSMEMVLEDRERQEVEGKKKKRRRKKK